jgi:glycosyltransferase involved in cell wall biosynthesis
MTDTTRPLVTFALFAYNQEKYIREAVEGAFSQTYEPLEIILSDDCSSDRTFEIMQEMAAAYEGPHQVRVRRNDCNVGTALHVQLAFEESKGELFVVAAGDDISFAKRVSSICSTWEQAGRPIGAIHSGRETFIEGSPESLKVIPLKRNKYSNNILECYARGMWLPAAAPTCAYTRDIFDRFDPLLGGSIIEDLPLMLRVALIGKFVECEEALVKQRIHSQNSGTGYTHRLPSSWNRFIMSKAVAFRNMQIDLNSADHDIEHSLKQHIEQKVISALHSTSSLVMSETRKLSVFGKICFAAKMLLSPAVTRTLRLRAEYTLSFMGFSFHSTLKNWMRVWLKV